MFNVDTLQGTQLEKYMEIAIQDATPLTYKVRPGGG